MTQQEKHDILKESHRSVMTQHYGENKTIELARNLGEWRGLETDVKRYAICQLQKTTRIKRRAEAVIPDTPTEPNEKIAMDIFGPLPLTNNEHEYILSIQDTLTKYLTLIPLKDSKSETIINELLDNFIYLFGAPKMF